MIWYYPCVTVFECICCYYNDWLYSSLAFSIFPTLKKANNAKAIKSKVNALICRWIQNASNFIILIVSWYLFWSSDYWLKSMKYKKADTKTVLFLWNSTFPAKNLHSGSHTTADFKSIMLSNQQLCVTRSKDSLMILAGNLLLHNNNTLFVSAFLQFMDFSNTFMVLVMVLLLVCRISLTIKILLSADQYPEDLNQSIPCAIPWPISRRLGSLSYRYVTYFLKEMSDAFKWMLSLFVLLPW